METTEIINGILAIGTPLGLAGWLFYTKRQNRILKEQSKHTAYELDQVQSRQYNLNREILEDTGCKSVRELLRMYSGVLRVLPSSLGRFYQSREFHTGYQYIPGPEIQRQVAVVGRVLRGMQEPKSRFRPVMETVVIDELHFAHELKEEFPDLLPLLEGLTFDQMVGLSLTIIDHGGIDIYEALRRINVDVEPTSPPRRLYLRSAFPEYNKQTAKKSLLDSTQLFAARKPEEVYQMYNEGLEGQGYDFVSEAAGRYLLGIASYLNSSTVRPACNLGYIAALVKYPDYKEVLTLLATEPAPKLYVEELLSAVEQGNEQQVANVVTNLQTRFAHLNPGREANYRINLEMRLHQREVNQAQGMVLDTVHSTEPAQRLNDRLRAHHHLMSELASIQPLPNNDLHMQALQWGLHYLAYRCAATAAHEEEEDPVYLPRLLAVYPLLEQYRAGAITAPFEPESMMQAARTLTENAVREYPEDEQYQLRFVLDRLLACNETSLENSLSSSLHA